MFAGTDFSASETQETEFSSPGRQVGIVDGQAALPLHTRGKIGAPAVHMLYVDSSVPWYGDGVYK